MDSIFDLYKSLAGSAGELMFGNTHSRGSFVQRQVIKTRTYEAIVNFWQKLTNIIDKHDSKPLSIGQKQQLEEVMNDFRDHIAQVYGEFEPGQVYDEEGLFEGLTTSASMTLHRVMWSREPVYRDLEYEIEKFWRRFMALRKEEKTEEDESLEISLDRRIAEETANFARQIYEKSFAAPVNSVNSLEITELDLKFRAKLHQSFETELTYNRKMRVAQAISHAFTQEILQDIAALLAKKLKQGQLIEVSPGFSSVLGILLIKAYIRARTARIKLFE
ncbi:MAG: hypothetical protein AAF570_11370, partial [Bacteroidota bacterium]